MGDRANIVLDFGPTNERNVPRGRYIFLHGHWAGCENSDRLLKALLRSRSWDNPSYVARIIAQTFFASVDEMWGGFGMSPYLCDNDCDLLVVDLPGKSLREVPGDDPAGHPVRKWTFREFISDGPTGWRAYETKHGE
jgi:hypothetical protein